jgi:methyl-accepting chemotaxis protein
MTRIAIATYYLAICVFLVCLVTLVVKLTFWPVCTGASACDGWTVAGLVGAIMGLSAVFLGILGAIALAAWWTSLDTRVEDRITQLLTVRVQAVQDSIDQLNGRVDELRTKADAIEEMIPELQQRIHIAQQSAQTALEEIEPPYIKQLRVHEQRMQKTTDQQGQSPDAR